MSALHPAQRFQAPRSIQRGVPLKDLLGPAAVTLVGEAFAHVTPGFDHDGYVRAATTGLEPLGILPRAAHIADALRAHLPPEGLAQRIIASLGPELDATEGYGLAPFFYLPTVWLIRGLVADPAGGLDACHAVTRRFTAEFCIRPFLLAHPQMTLARLTAWTTDPNPHVRRLVSEGSRPRLPWAERLPPFQRDPEPTLALLERLKDDPERYVTRSVANHLGDLAKDHPVRILAVLEAWLREAEALPPAQAEERRWMIRHAIRLPARQGVRAAVRLRKAAGGR